jgi:hypothetical protein
MRGRVANANSLSEGIMKSSTQVLLLTRAPAIQNLVEQICLIEGYRVITAATVEDAHALAAQVGREAFVLGVIDTEALMACERQQLDRVQQQWQAWIAAYSGLPLIFLGTMTPNGTFLIPDPSVFLKKPLEPYTLASVVRRFLAGQ